MLGVTIHVCVYICMFIRVVPRPVTQPSPPPLPPLFFFFQVWGQRGFHERWPYPAGSNPRCPNNSHSVWMFCRRLPEGARRIVLKQALTKWLCMFCQAKPKRAGAAHQGSVTRNLAHFGFLFALVVTLGCGGLARFALS